MSNPVTISLTVTIPSLSQSPTHSCAAPAIGASAATAALQRETRTIPIVFVSVADPVASGLVPRLNQPGGNITGFAIYEASLGGKWLELLSEIAPGRGGQP